MFENKTFITVKEISELLHISDSKSYSIVHKLNEELEARGYMTISGRVSRKYFEERFYGIEPFGVQTQTEEVKYASK